MAHQSLYRKYRPQTFGDVVGQDHITRTLRNAVEEGTVAHAYLFCGPRGTGKTTTARILAKALDCEKGPTPDPDDTCQSCVEITEGRHPDVYELDAASRTQVDNVRVEIIEKVMYAPTRGPWKVYVIDEVHMLSNHSFNALLKTIEEPPGKVLFILCTTHPHKVPDTIHSRCQRFDFRRIGVDDIVGRLASIAQREGISVDEGTLPLISRHAAGSMRDAIGTLDQLSAFTGKRVTLADVEGLLGEVDAARLSEITRLVAARDAAGCFRFVARLAEAGTDVPEFVRGLTAHIRDLYVLQAGVEAEGVISATHDELAGLSEEAGLFDLDRLGRLLDSLGQLAAELRWAPDARLTLEVALSRMARPHSDLTVSALAERVVALEAGAALSAPAAPEPVSPSASVRADAPAATPAELPPTPAPLAAPDTAPEQPADARAEPAPAAPATATPVPRRAAHASTGSGLDTATLRRVWKDVIREMKAQRPMASKAFLDTEVDLDGDVVVVEFASDRRTPMNAASEPAVKALLRESIQRVTGANVAVRYQLGRGVVRHEEHDALVPEPAGPDVVDASDDEAPSAAADQGHEVRSRPDDIERMLIDGLGAEVIPEHTLEEDPPKSGAQEEEGLTLL
jgi:DNA polymerase-3 subunit gamma/tau